MYTCSNGVTSKIFPFATQLKATPPARQTAFSPVRSPAFSTCRDKLLRAALATNKRDCGAAPPALLLERESAPDVSPFLLKTFCRAPASCRLRPRTSPGRFGGA